MVGCLSIDRERALGWKALNDSNFITPFELDSKEIPAKCVIRMSMILWSWNKGGTTSDSSFANGSFFYQ